MESGQRGLRGGILPIILLRVMKRYCGSRIASSDIHTDLRFHMETASHSTHVELERAPDRSPLGGRIGQYEIIRLLGRGGMGEVYLARDLRLGRLVAVKLLTTQRPDLEERFLVEARATARCQHENIVVIHEVGAHWGRPYMVLEYLEGQT